MNDVRMTESVVKACCSENEIAEARKSGLLSLCFYRFDVLENGFDPRILTPEQAKEERDEPWIFVLGVKHAEGRLKERYDSLSSLAEDVRDLRVAARKSKSNGAEGRQERRA